ncbi:unnamed protein product [Caenorhabditis brenneri]
MSEEKDPFKFFGFSDTNQPKNGMATKKEIDELLTFLGGFEKWPVLIEDCRREVVKYLDLQSRFNLGICSKDDHETVETTKIFVESVEILENARSQYQLNGRRKLNNVSVRIRFPNGKYIEWVFSQLKQDTRVQWLHRIPKKRPVAKEVIWKSCDYYEEAVKFAEKWMKKCNFELESITVGMAKYPFANSQIKSLPCCKEVKIFAYGVDSFGWWLTKCPELLENLQLVVHADHLQSFTFPSALLSAPQIIQASKIWFWCQAPCSDEQLLKLKAKSIYFNSVEVTDNGINKFLRNWVKGTSVNGFKELHIKANSVRDLDVMFAGLDYEEWDEEFENEQREFVEDYKQCFGLGRYYQLKSKVDPFESLTMSIHEHYCRKEVVKYLDYESRFNLGMCSKNDQETVEKAKICVESVEILDNEKIHYQILLINQRYCDNVTVRIRFPNGNRIEWAFLQLEQDTRVQWIHLIPEQRPVVREVIWISCDYYEEAVKFTEKWMKKCNFELNAITVGMAKYPFPTSQIKFLPCCKKVSISADDVEPFHWWLEKVPEQLDLLRLADHSGKFGLFTLPPNLLNSPQVMQASELDLFCRAVLSNEQLVKLNARSICLISADVTDEGINQFIKNWVNGKGVDGFKTFKLCAIGDRDSEVMVEGLDYVEWDETFENEQWEFVEDFKRCFGFGQCYQIKSKVDRFESLTLSIDDDCVSIYATGKRVENNGEASTHYQVPSDPLDE